MLDHDYNIIIDYGFGTTGHVREVFGGLNTTAKWFISMLMGKLNLLVPKYIYDDQMAMHSTAQKEDVSLENWFQKHLSNKTENNCVIDQGKHKNVPVNLSVMSIIVMLKIMLMLTTHMIK